MALIDAHQHVWDPTRAEYSWLGPELEPINRTVTFEEVEPSLARCGIQATILVQSADNNPLCPRENLRTVLRGR